jgi:hypothetical protein
MSSSTRIDDAQSRGPQRSTSDAAPAITPRGVSWLLGIDFGTTFTCAAAREGGRVRELHVDGRSRLPSAVFLDEDGQLLVRGAAESGAGLAPERFEPTPKRYLEVGAEGILLGDRYVPLREVVAAVLRIVWEEALLQHEGRSPHQIQSLLGLEADSWTSEVQADCFAGRLLGWMNQQGLFDCGDSTEIGLELAAVADVGPNRRQEHDGYGSRRECLAAFSIGLNQGAQGCLGEL